MEFEKKRDRTVYTLCLKKGAAEIWRKLRQISADFQNSFTAGKGIEFETKYIALVSNFLKQLIAVQYLENITIRKTRYVGNTYQREVHNFSDNVITSPLIFNIFSLHKENAILFIYCAFI